MRVSIPLLVAALLAMPAAGQLLPAGGLPGALAAPLGGLLPGAAPVAGQAPLAGPAPLLGGAIGLPAIDGAPIISEPRALLDLRRARLRQLLRDNRDTLAADPQGNPVRRDELVALDLDAASLDRLAALGFTRGPSDTAGATILRPPAGQPLDKALARLHAAGITADYNHVYEPAGMALTPIAPAAPAPASGPTADGASIGMIDGGVAAHPALAGAAIEQRGFAGAVKATGHGTAVASLLVGEAPHFAGAARGARLLVADVYGGASANGAAVTIARAIDWLVGRGARVINISLVGPPNLLIARAVAGAQARGVLVVAAVGNDGPAAPPLYPASYPQVVAVTAVDAKGRLLPEAGRAAHVDFAAPGADMAAALMDGRYVAVRGTSFAAPLVSARLAAFRQDALAAVAAEARPSGNARLGRGIVCDACRNPLKPLLKK